jgi:hypothetical protein
MLSAFPLAYFKASVERAAPDPQLASRGSDISIVQQKREVDRLS